MSRPTLKQKVSDVQSSYNLVADEYSKRIYNELEHKPLDRQLLDRFVSMVPKGGFVCDIGTGPGHVARYLHDRGVHVCGIDLSEAMVARARTLNPAIEFRTGNMLSLDIPDKTFDAITGFYALVNLARNDMVRALRELGRVLKPGGFILLAFYIGDHGEQRKEWWGAEVSLYFYFFRLNELGGYLKAAGFEVGRIIERDPYPGIEQPNRRGYIFARRPLPVHRPVITQTELPLS